MGNRPSACCGDSAGEDPQDPLDLMWHPGLLLRDLEHLGEGEELVDGAPSESSPQDLMLRAERASLRRQLLAAVRCDDAPAILQLVSDGADLGVVGEALRLAAMRGSTLVLRELVAVGLGVNEACTHTGLTPLQLAAASGHATACELLLDALADVHAPEASGTPLSLARKMGHVEVEEILERHVAMLITEGEEETMQAPRAQVLPRVSPNFSEAFLGAVQPAQASQPEAEGGPCSADDLPPGPPSESRRVAALPLRGGSKSVPQVLPL